MDRADRQLPRCADPAPARTAERGMVAHENAARAGACGLRASRAVRRTPRRERGVEAWGQGERCGDRLRSAAMAAFLRTERMAERLADRLKPDSILRTIERAESRLQQASGLLESYSYERVLDRGFVLVCDAKDGPVTSA